jgi:multidrug resistance efflux pump
MGGVSWTAAVTQAQVRLDATERVVASAQLEAWLADDDAQSVHAELDRHRRSTTVKEFSLKLARCRVLPMRAPLVNWKTPCSIGRLWTYRLGRRSPSRMLLKERESAKKMADRSQKLDATAPALQQAVVVAPVAGVVVGRKGGGRSARARARGRTFRNRYGRI